jgi:hypothetical protein
MAGGGWRKAGVRRGVLRLGLRESKGKMRFLTLLRSCKRLRQRWGCGEEGDRYRRRLGFAELGHRRACGAGDE